MTYDVFISYHQDTGADGANRIRVLLEGKGISCFVAARSIEPGELWLANVRCMLRDCGCVVVLVTQNSANSPWVRAEVACALLLGKRVIPVVLGSKDALSGPLNEMLVQIQHKAADNPERLAEIIHEAVKLKEFRDLFFPGSKNTRVCAVLSAKGGIEYEGGRPIVDLVNGVPVVRPGHTRLLSFNEIRGYLELKRVLAKGSSEEAALELCHAQQVDLAMEALEHGNGIVVGSPHANVISRRLLNHRALMHMPFRFRTLGHEKVIEHIPSGALYAAATEADEEVSTDVGLVLKVTNPFAPGSKVLLLAGNHGFGTEAALRFVTLESSLVQLQRALRAKAVYSQDAQNAAEEGDFAMLLRAPAGVGGGGEPEVVRVSTRLRDEWS
jgi:hypothetical protein